MPVSVTTEYITYPSGDRTVTAYVARPAEGTGPWPGLVVIQEIFGLVEHIEEKTRKLAAEGYVAVAPDLYCHDSRRKNLTTQDIEECLPVRRAEDPEAALAQIPEDRRAQVRAAYEFLQTNDKSTYVPDLQAAVDYLKTRSDVRPEAIGSIGWCMGGGLSGALAASGADLAAAVIYYGPIPDLDKVGNIKCPVQGHYGGDDAPITSRVPEFEAAMKAAGKYLETYIYEGAPHAFTNDHRVTYREEPTRIAWGRTLEFLERHLKQAPVAAR